MTEALSYHLLTGAQLISIVSALAPCQCRLVITLVQKGKNSGRHLF